MRLVSLPLRVCVVLMEIEILFIERRLDNRNRFIFESLSVLRRKFRQEFRF